MTSKSIFPRPPALSDAETILGVIADKWGLATKDVLGRSRRQPLAFARQLGMTLTYRLTHMSLTDVGDYYGGRDHGTVIHARRCVDKASDDDEVKELIGEVVRQIKRAADEQHNEPTA